MQVRYIIVVFDESACTSSFSVRVTKNDVCVSLDARPSARLESQRSAERERSSYALCHGELGLDNMHQSSRVYVTRAFCVVYLQPR